MKDLSVDINGEKFELSEKVFKLILNISKERDEYFELLEHTHSLLLKKYGDYKKSTEVERALQIQRNYRTKNLRKN